eukprot:3941081-Rhodomonas_salina.1
MSGTRVRYAAMLLPAPYAMSGTDIPNSPQPQPPTLPVMTGRYWRTLCIHAAYAMSGTDIRHMGVPATGRDAKRDPRHL